MKKSTKALLALSAMFLVLIPLVPSYVIGWKAEESVSDNRLLTRPRFSTHQWLAWEAVEMFPTSKMSWITENLHAFWNGVEAPFMDNASFPYGYTYGSYGDIDGLVLLLDGSGTTVVNSSLSDRAQTEYDKLIIELLKNDTDYEMAAFYAGTMSHYIAQAGFFKALWDNVTAPWGYLNNTKINMFESAIERGSSLTYFNTVSFNINYYDLTVYYNNFFTLTPTEIASEDAKTAAEDLAKNVWPVAQSLYDDYNETILNAEDWETTYYNTVKDCLTQSVEAIYAALSDAMDSIDWRYISLPEPSFTFNNFSCLIDVPEFEAKYYDSTGEHIINESIATMAELWYVYQDQTTGVPRSMSSDKVDLEYNPITQKWLYNNSIAYYTAAKTNHTIVYHFDIDLAAPTWSNLSSSSFNIDYYNVTVTNLNYKYNSMPRTLDIYNITAYCYDIPEIAEIEPEEILTAEWLLYQTVTGATQIGGEVVGVQMRDTIGTYIKGTLQYNATSGTYYSLNNDIGLVFTSSSVNLYVIARFTIIIPVGFYKTSITGGGQPVFYPYVQKVGTDYFRTRDHQVTISKPVLEYNETTGIINMYNITAITDYGHVFLDYEEIINKTVIGDDRREARWKIFLFDGIASGLTGPLSWNFTGNYWYAENISVLSLPDNTYYMSAKIVNMNINFTTSPWGPASDLFVVKRPIPVIYYILPEFFIAGFVVLFGWLAWYRPRQKKRRIEAERAAKLGKGFMD
ncbi:MAG: hypothetical protein JXA54_00765 [Candidatus Heimdallarchaeota archaeon]|nr:hypothetical protein [Candidatus Heimdallarchaeota archaeon]